MSAPLLKRPAVAKALAKPPVLSIRQQVLRRRVTCHCWLGATFIINQGANLKAGAAIDLNAGRNVLLVSAEENNGQMRQDKRHFWSNSSTTQHAGEVQAGTQLNVSAEQDIAIVASRLKAGGDMSLQAGGDVLITSAANAKSSEDRKSVV